MKNKTSHNSDAHSFVEKKLGHSVNSSHPVTIHTDWEDVFAWMEEYGLQKHKDGYFQGSDAIHALWMKRVLDGENKSMKVKGVLNLEEKIYLICASMKVGEKTVNEATDAILKIL